MFLKLIFPILAALAASPVAAGTLFAGIEDYASASGLERQGDFNDLVFSMAGDISTAAPGAVYKNLTPSMVDESGSLYFDQHSLDGEDYNIGYCVMGMGACHLPVALGDMKYLADGSGADPLSITLSAHGAITFDLLLKETALPSRDTLGWYDPADPSILHMIFAGPDSAGTSVTVNMNGDFVLFSQNAMGQFYTSVAASNINESVGQQHFALFQDPPPGAVPEPMTMVLVGLSLVGIGCQGYKRRLG